MCAKPKTKKPAAEIVKGVILSLMITTVSAAIFAILIHNQTASEAASGIWRIGTIGIAALFGCLFGAGRIGEKSAIYCAIITGVFFFILLAIGILFFDGGVKGIGGNLISAMVGGVISCFIMMKKPARKTKFKIRSR